ncbi:MAG: Glu-tRNA(Gln) amidotransferase subunit GatE [Kosmotogaceae bacterium]|nr:Glu-tRNA(Gln) amidotransferase subunit GatE [Kosmotogaceae bacterium]
MTKKTKDKEEPDYKKLKLKAGIEIHQQLGTNHKLFCKCSADMQNKEVYKEIIRRQHPVASEMGEVDAAVLFEALKERSFKYQITPDEVCLVELDEEPPHDINPNALRIATEIALFLNCDIPNEVHVMRKTITDGSNTGAFQRTMIVGLNGWLKYGNKKIGITQVALEEDSASIVDQQEEKSIYRLNRLGIPLVEITTDVIEELTPEQVQEVAYLIGIICRSTGKVKHGIGSIRQDVNVSIKGGDRVEIKGVQELGLLSKVIKKEVHRQLEVINSGKKVENETRSSNPDGSTKYNRPLPGSARMYPETDVVPISVEDKWIKQVKKSLPEPWTNKLTRFKKDHGLSNDLAIQIIGSDYLELFEKVISTHPKLNAVVVSNVFTSIMKDLRRKGIDTEGIREKHFLSVFDALDKERIVKEAIPQLLTHFASNPEDPLTESIKKLNLTMLSKDELKSMITELIADSPDTNKDKIYGIAMSRARGRSDPKEVMDVVDQLMKKK